MKRFAAAAAFAFAAAWAPCQVGGGAVYSSGSLGLFESVFKNSKESVPTSRSAQTVDASVLLNVKPDSFVAVFSGFGEGETPALARTAIAAKVKAFKKSLTGMGMQESQIFVDYVTQSRLYGVQGTASENIEILKGYRVQETVSIVIRKLGLVDELTQKAEESGGFELAAMNAHASDLDKIRKTLFTEATRIIRDKLRLYKEELGLHLGIKGIDAHRMSAVFPLDRYASYTAADETDYRGFDRSKPIVLVPRLRSFYYRPVDSAWFDSVLNPLELEPSIQFGLYLRVKAG